MIRLVVRDVDGRQLVWTVSRATYEKLAQAAQEGRGARLEDVSFSLTRRCASLAPMADGKRPIRLRDALRLPAFTDNPPFDPAELEAFHEKCRSHKEAIGKSEECGCFHCLSIFHPSEIVRWVRSTEDRTDLTCAVCPHCSVDAVLPGAEVDLSPELLQQMRDRWFRVAADQN